MIITIRKVFLSWLFLMGSYDPMDRIANDTWKSIVEMTNSKGLTDDQILMVNGQKTLTRHTSPTNIAMYLFSVTSARNLDIISQEEAESRIKTTLETVKKLERHHGLFLNWYDPETCLKISTWYPGGHSVDDFLSSVDNAWLAVALLHVSENYQNLRSLSQEIVQPMEFHFLYNDQIGAFRGGWNVGSETFSKYDYTMLYSETRIVNYAAAKLGQIPSKEMRRLIAAKRDGVLLSSYGSLFEALAVALYVPEMSSPEWADEHRNYLKKHIANGQGHIWGISYSDDGLGVYKEYGIDELALYPAHYGHEGVVTPYASFLSLQVDRPEAMKNILKLDSSCYGQYGFFGAYNPHTGAISSRVLILEQGIILTSIANDRGKNPCKGIFDDLVIVHELFDHVSNK